MARYLLPIMRRGAFLILMASATLNGQSDLDAVRPFTGLSGPGGRASGLGMAFTGIADDATALYYNPAGLAHLTRGEINLGLTYLNVNTDVSLQGISNAATITATRLGNAGFTLPIPDLKMTVALGYHQVRAFERLIQIETSDDTGTIKESLTEEGQLGALSLGASYQVSPQLALGVAVDILTGRNAYTWDSTYSALTTGDSSYYLFAEPEYTGVGLNLGVLLAPLPSWRIGLLLRTPQGIRVNEESTDETLDGMEIREYRTRSSYYLRLGSSLTIGPVLVSGDLFWFDYSQIRFESDFTDNTDIDINEVLRTRYASALGYTVGVELLLPGINAKLRGGYRIDPPLNRDSPAEMTQHTFALGLSVVPVPQIKIDAACNLTSWERTYSGWPEEDTASSVTVNFIYRF